MESIESTTISAPQALQNDVECIRTYSYAGQESISINVTPIAVPGVVFQSQHGHSAVKNLVTGSAPAKITTIVPTSYIHGPGVKPCVWNFNQGPFDIIHVILKPHALKTLLGMDARTVGDRLIELNEFSGEDLNSQLINAKNNQDRAEIFEKFLFIQHQKSHPRDPLIEDSLVFVQQNVETVTKDNLPEHYHISRRQFDRRFAHAVGITPLLYIRVKRFNEALRLMQTGNFELLTEVVYALNFYDQSHFIRDLKEFSGITPTSIYQKVADFHEHAGLTYL